MIEALELQTEQPGVVVRQLWTHDDDVAYQDSYDHSRPEIAEVDHLAFMRHVTVADTRQARLDGTEAGRLLTGIWDGRTFVGSANARPQEDGSIEVGYWADSRCTGNGYTSLGTAALVEFLSQDYQRIYTKVLETNTASAHISERAGLRRVAQEAGELTFELLSRRECPFPYLKGDEFGVEPDDYRLLDGSDAPIQLEPSKLELVSGVEPQYPELLPGVRLRGTYIADGVAMPIVSFLYNKLGSDGNRERDKRVIIVEGIGYGVHSGHVEQSPTWYLVGPKIGTISHETGEFVSAVQEPVEVAPNNFSIACITHGPFGVPLLANPPREQR